jgi:superfamily II DNA or RNA helicase
MITVNQLIQGTNIEPRPYQARIVAKALDFFLQKGLRSILLESPTGSGKTVMGLLIAQGLQQALGLKVGWVAMRRYLLAQAEAEIAGRGLSVKASFISMFEKDPPRGLDLLVVDEAQHDAASSMAHLHAAICPKYILGLSATPFRADKVKLCFDTVIRDAGIQQLIQDGYLSRYHHYTVPNFAPATVCDFYAREPERWGKTIFYFHTLPQCFEARKLLAKRGFKTEVVTGSSDREAQLDAFRAGKLHALINCIVLAEGFDFPALQTVFCRPSGKAITVQMCGRVFRKHPAVPVKQVVQCQKTRWPFVRTASADVSHVWTAGGWRTLQVNDRIQQVGLVTLKALAGCDVKLPEYLEKRRPRSERLAARREALAV